MSTKVSSSAVISDDSSTQRAVVANTRSTRRPALTATPLAGERADANQPASATAALAGGRKKVATKRHKNRHKKYTPRDVRVPTMVALNVTLALGIQNHMALTAMVEGWAEVEQFDTLVECCEMLSAGAVITRNQETQNVADMASTALLNIKDRHQRTQRIAATGDELQALRVFIAYSEDFWNRQGGTTFAKAYALMRKAQLEATSAAPANPTDQ